MILRVSVALTFLQDVVVPEGRKGSEGKTHQVPLL
jgi:hypothetical protein